MIKRKRMETTKANSVGVETETSTSRTKTVKMPNGPNETRNKVEIISKKEKGLPVNLSVIEVVQEGNEVRTSEILLMTTRFAQEISSPEEIAEEGEVVVTEVIVAAEEEETLFVMDLVQEAWIENSTMDQWVVAQIQGLEDHAKSGALDLTLTVHQVEMISMLGHTAAEVEKEVTEVIGEENEDEAA